MLTDANRVTTAACHRHFEQTSWDLRVTSDERFDGGTKRGHGLVAIGLAGKSYTVSTGQD